MTFKNFEQIVMQQCENVEKVSQKAHTQDGGVMVKFKGSQKGYIFQGSYSHILSRLGVRFISDVTVESYKQMISKAIENANSDNPIGSLFITKEQRKQQQLDYASSLQKELDGYKGCILINESGKVLGTY